MSSIGQIEKMTQHRVLKLFCDTLGYEYLGNWKDREGNRNIEEKLLHAFLTSKQGYDDNLITRALYILDKAAGDTSWGGSDIADRGECS
jgi:type I restriction enzyme R subunit